PDTAIGARPKPWTQASTAAAPVLLGAHEGHGGLVPPDFPQGDVHHIGKAVPVEDLGNGVPYIIHDNPQAAVGLVRAGAGTVGGLAHAANGREGPVDEAYHVAELDLAEGFTEEVTPLLPALRLQIAGVLELHQDLLEELDGQLFLLRQLARPDQGFPQLLDDPQVDEGPEGVLAPLRE